MERLEGEEAGGARRAHLRDDRPAGRRRRRRRRGRRRGRRGKVRRGLLHPVQPTPTSSLLARLHTSLLPSRPIISPQKSPVLPRQRVRLPDSHLANYATAPHLAPGETVGAPSPLSSRPPHPPPPICTATLGRTTRSRSTSCGSPSRACPRRTPRASSTSCTSSSSTPRGRSTSPTSYASCASSRSSCTTPTDDRLHPMAMLLLVGMLEMIYFMTARGTRGGPDAEGWVSLIL